MMHVLVKMGTRLDATPQLLDRIAAWPKTR